MYLEPVISDLSLEDFGFRKNYQDENLQINNPLASPPVYQFQHLVPDLKTFAIFSCFDFILF